MFTANSMNCLSEALGMALPGNGTIPSYYGERLAMAKRAGMRVVKLVEENLRPRDIMTEAAFSNAIHVDMAIAGSTNTTLHLPAIANELGIPLPLKKFDEIARPPRTSATSARTASTTWTTSTAPAASTPSCTS